MTDRFLLDVMLGRLATYLRMCGYDTAYALDRDLEADDALLAAARRERRRIVTRDAGLAGRADPDPGAILLEARDIDGQLRALRAAGIELGLADPPARCGRCNGEVERVPADASTPAYAPAPEGTAVWRCRACDQCFWRGSHWEDVQERLASL